jgi:chromosome segregation ATPase
MKVRSSLKCALLAVACQTWVVTGRVSKNPLGEVIGLLDDLSAKITKEGVAESAAFKEYTAWCDDFSTNKNFEITTATSQKGKLEARIVKQAATIEETSSTIEDLAAGVSTATADLNSATAIRKQEAAEFKSGEKELVEVIDSLARAVTILDREMQKNPAAFAQVDRSDLNSVVQSLGAVVDAAALSVSTTKQLLAFVQSQQGSVEDDSELGAPAADVYTTHSTSILDVLEDLREKAEAQLSELRKSELNSKHNFDLSKQSLKDQITADTKEMDKAKSLMAATKEGKATAEGDLKVTIKDLDTANEALDTATTSCKEVGNNHVASMKAREEELKVVSEAKDILKSSTAGAVGQTYSFLEVRGGSRIHSGLSELKVAAFIKKLALKQHSAALAQLASRVAAVARDSAHEGDEPFAKVNGLIESMIAKLQAEAGAEATEKAYCDEELSKTAEKTEDLGSTISKLTSNIDLAAARSAELKDDVKQLQSELATISKEQAEMDSMREEGRADYVQAKADLELGISGVRKALLLLRDYYGQKDADASFVQQPARPTQHESASGSANSIIGILEVAESDFASNLAKEETVEAEAQESYEKMSQENKVTKATKDKDVQYKTKEITSLEKTMTELGSDREAANTEAAAVLEYDTKLKERCIAKPETYESRKKRRENEIAGLKEALSILDSESSLLQRRGKKSGHHMRGALLKGASS